MNNINAELNILEINNVYYFVHDNIYFLKNIYENFSNLEEENEHILKNIHKKNN